MEIVGRGLNAEGREEDKDERQVGGQQESKRCTEIGLSKLPGMNGRDMLMLGGDWIQAGTGGAECAGTAGRKRQRPCCGMSPFRNTSGWRSPAEPCRASGVQV